MKLKYLILAILPVTLLFTSCLKSRDSLGVVADEGSISTGIFDRFYFGEAKPIALNGQPPIETISDFLKIWYSAPRKKAGNIHVKLAVDNSLVTAYNTANGTNYLALPANSYTLPNGLELDLPAGNSGEYFLPFRLDKNALNLQNAYAIGIKIESVSEGVINELEKSLIVAILVKNEYDGVYTVKGMFHHPSGANPPGVFETEVELHTTGTTKAKMYWPLAGTYASPIIYGGDLSYFGSQVPEFNVAGNNSVTVTNVGGSLVYAMGQGFDNAGYNHRYDPLTKTFYACWGYNLGPNGEFLGNGSASRIWADTLIYLGPR